MMTKAMNELFALPLSAGSEGAIIERKDDGDIGWVAEVAPRTEGRWNQTLLVGAQERAEAIVAAVNEIDMLRAELAASEARAERLARIIRLDYGADAIEMFSVPGWGTTELGRAQAALLPSDLKEATK